MARLDGQEFVLDSNYGSIFPQPLQSVHGNYSPGVTLLRFSRTPQGLAMTVYERQERNVLYIDRDGGFHDARVAMREEVHLVSTRALWRVEDDLARLVLLTSFVETPDTCLLYMTIRPDSIQLSFRENPSAEGAMRMLLDLVGLTDKAAVKRLVPLMKHVPGFNENTVNEMVQRNATPVAQGVPVKHHDLMLTLPAGASPGALPAATTPKP